MGIKAPISHEPTWTVVSLAEITIKIGSGATPKGGAESYLPNRTNFALVRSQNVFDRYFDPAGLAFISDEQAHGLRGVVLQPNDILLNITGDGITFGRACNVPNDILPACVNQHVSIIRIDPKRADPGYVLSFLTHPDVKAYIESFNAGGSRRAITKGHIESFRLPLPPFEEQRAIAHVLGTLDDKIELSRKQDETLEAMARTLFKAWFVDFKPVRAKMEGRWQRGQSLPGLPAQLYDLFPERLVESELGEIPEGWPIVAFGDVAHQVKGAVNPGRAPQEAFTHYSLPAFDTGQAPVIELGAAIKSNKTPVPDGAVLVSKLNPHIPRIWMVDKAGANAVCSTEFIAWTPKAPANSAFLYCLASSPEFNSAMRQLVTGTSNSHQRVKPDQLRDIRVVAASPKVIEGFSEVVRSSMEQVLLNRNESRSLAQLRDTLLPKLVSGELRVPDAARLLGEAVTE